MSATAKITSAHTKNYSDKKKNVNVRVDHEKFFYFIHVDL